MTQPLNYTPKAIEALLSFECSGAPLTRAGNLYIVEKLRQAEVFVIGEHGQLLDRSKPRPEVPGAMLRPAFPVVALEYSAQTMDWDEGFYTAAKCSKRIALAWEWTDDLPSELAAFLPTAPGPGVVIASVAYYDAIGTWVVVYGAAHLAYDDAERRAKERPPSPYFDAALASGRITAKVANSSGGILTTPIPLSPETITIVAARHGHGAVTDLISADLMDEVNAYLDLCLALGCRNVATRKHEAPTHLNRQRVKAGKVPLKGFHVLELTGGAEMPGAGGGGHGSPRSHLRRGHIRRLPGERVTWVNSTIVRGRGFVDKVYAV